MGVFRKYGEVLSPPGAGPAVIASVFGRLALGMTGLALLLLVRKAIGSYADAGFVNAAYAISFALAAPYRARAADRRGPAAVLRVTGPCQPLAFGLLVVLADAGASPVLMAAAAVLIGFTVPPLGAVSVRDGSTRPLRRAARSSDEAARGLLLVDALCHRVVSSTRGGRGQRSTIVRRPVVMEARLLRHLSARQQTNASYPSGMSAFDVRGTAAWNTVEEHFRRTHEPAMGRPSRLIEPSCSADGSRIAVTAFVYDELRGLPRRQAFLVEGHDLRPLACQAGSSRLPKVSPDGKAVALLSDRAESGRFQLFVLRAGELGEAAAAPQVPGTVEYLSWSADGERVLLGVAGLGADLAGGQGSGRTYKPKEELPEWHPHVEAGVVEESWRSIWTYELATAQLSRVSPEGLNAWEAVWLGNDAVVAVTSPDPGEGAWYAAVLTRIALSGTTSELLRSEVQLGWPAASLDASRLAVVEAVCSDRWTVAGDLLVGAPGQALEKVDTNGVDVTATQWVDGRRLGLLGIRGLETVAAIFDAETGKTTELWSSTSTSCGRDYPEGAWTADGRVVLVEEGYAKPQQVVVLGENRMELAEIRHAGTDYLLSVGGNAEAVAWSAPDGLRIEGILCTPEGKGPFPLVVNIHGGPVWAYRNLFGIFDEYVPLLVSQGYAVLNPNPRGSSGRGQDFARLVFGEMGGDDTRDVTSAVDALVERGLIDPGRVGLIGCSYGGFMSAWLVTQDQRWAAAVPTSPVTNWYSQHFTSNIPHFDALFLNGDPEVPGDKFHLRSPVAHASRVRTPCLNVAGAQDRCTPPTQAQEFHQALVEHGVESELVIYPQEGHGTRAFPAVIDYTTRVVAWFHRHMPA